MKQPFVGSGTTSTIVPATHRTDRQDERSPTARNREAEPRVHKGVQGVLVERDDGTCVSFGLDLNGEWPTIDHAWHAVKNVSAQLAWRETTPGVWVARAKVDDSPDRDRRPSSGRRAEASPSVNSSTRDQSYMAARVLRSAIQPAQSHQREATRISSA